jgi:hypothetical protein
VCGRSGRNVCKDLHRVGGRLCGPRGRVGRDVGDCRGAGNDARQGEHPDDVSASGELHGDTHSVNVGLTVGESCAQADCERVNVRHGGRARRSPGCVILECQCQVPCDYLERVRRSDDQRRPSVRGHRTKFEPYSSVVLAPSYGRKSVRTRTVAHGLLVAEWGTYPNSTARPSAIVPPDERLASVAGVLSSARFPIDIRRAVATSMRIISRGGCDMRKWNLLVLDAGGRYYRGNHSSLYRSRNDDGASNANGVDGVEPQRAAGGADKGFTAGWLDGQTVSSSTKRTSSARSRPRAAPTTKCEVGEDGTVDPRPGPIPELYVLTADGHHGSAIDTGTVRLLDRASITHRRSTYRGFLARPPRTLRFRRTATSSTSVTGAGGSSRSSG